MAGLGDVRGGEFLDRTGFATQAANPKQLRLADRYPDRKAH
jgi:hypothetical protein